MASMSEQERSARRSWLLKVVQVCTLGPGPGQALSTEAFSTHEASTKRHNVNALLFLQFQGQKVQQSWQDITALMRPLFQGITNSSSQRCVRIDSKVCCCLLHAIIPINPHRLVCWRLGVLHILHRTCNVALPTF